MSKIDNKIKEINITAGEEMNKELILRKENCIAFNEAMINGRVTTKLFSSEFLEERSKTHNVNLNDYKEKMNNFIEFLDEINIYEKVNLWFGIEPFCQINLLTVLACLESKKCEGYVELNLIDESNNKKIDTKEIYLNGFEKAFYDMTSLVEVNIGDSYMALAIENYINANK